MKHTFMNLCFESLTMSKWLERMATDGCLAGRWLFINNAIHQSFLVISFHHPPPRQFSSLVWMTSIIGLLPRFAHRIDGFPTTQMNQPFNFVCIYCVSLLKTINFAFRVFLEFILCVCVLYVSVFYKCMCVHIHRVVGGCCLRLCQGLAGNWISRNLSGFLAWVRIEASSSFFHRKHANLSHLFFTTDFPSFLLSFFVTFLYQKKKAVEDPKSW